MKIALNWLLFAGESTGALMILWNGVPIHQRLLMGSTAQQAGPSVFVLGALAVILIQSTYWIRLRCFPPLRFKRHLVLGHAIQFLGRLSFVFIGGMFSVVFFTRFEELEFSIWKVLRDWQTIRESEHLIRQRSAPRWRNLQTRQT